ncbi:MAG TPA: ATP-binding protein [Actinomycetota bacterium]|nr:ATP-binding protein [Actinomycetota bacterium]
MSTTPLELEIPPIPAYVGTVRLFVAAVARQAGIEEDEVDDLKVMVSEACTGAIRNRSEAASEEGVRVQMTPGDGTLLVEVPRAFDEDAVSSEGTTDNIARGLGAELVRALFPQAELVPDGAGMTSLRVVLATGGSAGSG